MALLMSASMGFGYRGASAQTDAAASGHTDADATLDEVRKQIDAVQKSVHDDTPDADLLRLAAQVAAAQTRAGETGGALAPQLADVQARLTELGTPTPGSKEDADVAVRRTQLDKSRIALDGQLKLARLLGVEAEQLAARLWAQRRSQFQARLGERTASILGRSFWVELRGDFPRDAERLRRLADELALAAGPTPAWGWAGVLLLGVGVVGLRAWIDRRLQRIVSTRVAAGRLRRSLYALLTIGLWTGAAGLLAQALQAAVDWDGTLPEPTAELLTRLTAMLWFGGYMGGLAQALIRADQPSWRLLPLPDAVADRLRRAPLLVSLVGIASWLAEQLTTLVDASLTMVVAVNCIVAIALGLTMGVALVRAEHLWRRLLLLDGAKRRPIWLAVVSVGSWIVLLGGLICLLAGYVAFGSFAVKQVLWISIVVGSCVVLGMLIDDAITTWIAPRAAEADAAPRAAPPGRPRDQAAVLLSALLRTALVLFALMLLIAPFGEGPSELLRRTGQWQEGLTIGKVQLQPSAVLQALLMLVGGLGVARLLRHWLTETYLPTTSLDPGMRASAITLFGYAGSVVAVSLALSALGIGLERIAWVASALSVGIGFGLQAVVQNFVSGLILLAERPVKVGDWVSLGGVEGDIRRINVRATEIEMGDRSTVIVPNSEFITKIVRNVTLANPLGLVQMKLPMPLDTDVQQVRTLLLDAFTAAEDVLETPAPSVLLDGIEAGALVFNATGFVSSPRRVGGVRSDLLFDVLGRLRAAGIGLSAGVAAAPVSTTIDPAPKPLLPT